VEEAVISVTALTNSFVGAYFPNRTLVASITLEKVQKLALVDSSIGGVVETKQETIGQVFKLDQSNKVVIEFGTQINADRAFEITKLTFQNALASRYTVLNELDALRYISANPAVRSVSPLLRMLSSQPQENSICESLEVPNMVDGIPAAFLSFVCLLFSSYFFLFVAREHFMTSEWMCF